MSKTILIVDDSESIREFLHFTLATDGYKVFVGTNGKDALKFFGAESEPIDLVITDLHMPEMDGIQLLQEIRKMDKFKHLPILFLTTESGIEQKMQAKKAGATGWIVKPITPDKLLAVLTKCLR
ncbi:MAG: response regulator [Bacteroidales bacterium]|nr:response regulator [Bacteroidales bacterium]